MTRAKFIRDFIADVLRDSIPDLAYDYRDKISNTAYSSIDWMEEEVKMEQEVERLLGKLGVSDDY